MVPRCKGGTEIVPTCHSCEDFIHKTWSHNELRDVFNTVEAILADTRFQKFLKWLHKQQDMATSAVSAVGREAKEIPIGRILTISVQASGRSQNSVIPNLNAVRLLIPVLG